MADSSRSLNGYLRNSSSVLLLAPLHGSPEDSACIDLLTRDLPADTNVLSVTLSAAPAERLAVWQREDAGAFPTRTTVIDARRELNNARLPVSESGPVSVRALPGDADLDDLGLAIADQLGRWEATDETTVVCLHSVTTLLETYDTDRVISLIAALNDLCERLGAIAHHHVDVDEHDEETVTGLRPLYDAVVEYTADGGWIPTEREASTTTPTFRSTTTPPGGAAKTDPDRPETVPMRYSFDTILELLSCPRRRTLLYNLQNQSSEEIALDRLVEEVHDIDRSLPVREGSPREDIRRGLVHTHLPKLRNAGIVEFDADSETVHYTVNQGLESFLRYLETVELG